MFEVPRRGKGKTTAARRKIRRNQLLRADLLLSWSAGLQIREAAMMARCSTTTVQRHYRIFKEEKTE